MQSKTPNKKNDNELWELVKRKIETVDYVFLNHAKTRLQERNVNDFDVSIS